MCGIAGFAGRGDATDLQRMTDAMVHRGPDGEGQFADLEARCFLGHRRLAVVDLSDGAQPMSTADGDLVVSYNGEIYNHLELRRHLESAGHRFTTDHSDTEVLLHGYRAWGPNLVERLNGMWAFALYDRRARTLFLSRDRFGQKPVYYAQRRGLFAFASELTGLLAHGALEAGLSTTGLQKYFAYGFVPAPHTIAEGVHKLPAGHTLTVDLASMDAKLRCYWRYRIEPWRRGTDRELAEELRHHLAAAVKRRLMADVPLGVFLSGGLDSSLVTALAVEAQGAQQTPTFSIAVDRPTFDESHHAAVVARHLGTPHHVHRVTLARALSELPDVVERLDEPLGDSSLYPTWTVCAGARKRVTVALGGDGADELFAGYAPFKALLPGRVYSRLVPNRVHKRIRSAVGRLPTRHGYMSLDFKLKRALSGMGRPRSLWAPSWMGPLDAGEVSELLRVPVAAEELYAESIAAWERCPSTDPVDRLTTWFVDVYLADDILCKVDRASMMSSLEVRSPFLDIELVDFVRTLPARARLRRGHQTKAVLREVAEGLLPPSVSKRSKQGFALPVGPWLHDGSLSLQPPAPPLSEAAVGRRSRAHTRGVRDERLFLYALWVLQRYQGAA